MTIKSMISAGALAASLLTAPIASAEPLQIKATTTPASARESRPFTLSAVGSAYFTLPMAGIEAEYQLTDRFAVGARLSTILLGGDASANARYFFHATPTSGVYAELAAHAIGFIGYSGTGGAAEIGYEHRSMSGFTLGVSGGLTVLAGESCGCGRPSADGEERTEWTAIPTLNFRLGYAF